MSNNSEAVNSKQSEKDIQARRQGNEDLVKYQMEKYEVSAFDVVAKMCMDVLTIEERDKLSTILEMFNYSREVVEYKKISDMDGKTLVHNLREMLELKIATEGTPH